MARRSNTTTSSTPSNESDSASDNTNGPGTGIGADASSPPGAADASSSPGTLDATPPAKRRKRGPNKPKPGAFTVRTEAILNQTEICRLLTAHAVARLGEEVAAKMTLQVNVDGKWRRITDVPSQGDTLQFATIVEADE